jgi:hypothetical protein
LRGGQAFGATFQELTLQFSVLNWIVDLVLGSVELVHLQARSMSGAASAIFGL